MIPVLSIHQPYASLIFAPAHCGECGGSGLTDDRDSDGYPRPAQWDGMVNLGPHCPVCNGKGRCDPIPVKGRQGIWQWDGTRRPT